MPILPGMTAVGAFTVCLLIIVLVLTLIFIYWISLRRSWGRLGIPGPPPIPFLGNAHQFFNPKVGIRASVRKWQAQYGNVIGVHFFRKPCLVITDVDVLKEILVRKYNLFPDRFWIGGGTMFPDVVNRAMSHQKGADWKRLRHIMSPTFTSVKLKLLTSEMNRTASQLADVMAKYASSGTRPEAKDVYSAYTLDIIARTAFGLKSNCLTDRDDSFFKMATRLFSPTTGTKIAMSIIGMFPVTGHLLRKMNIAFFSPESLSYLEEIVWKLVAERKKEDSSSSSSRTITNVDFLQLLVRAEADPSYSHSGKVVEGVAGRKQQQQLSEEEVVSQGIMFITAGYETTSSTLQYMSHVMAKRRDVQDKVLREMREVVGDATDVITYEHCEKMNYTEAVIHETIRLHPPVHLLFREALQDTTVQGITIPARTGILVPVFNTGQDPELFPDPEKFDPDRFLGEDAKNNYIGFGLGPKTCMGLRLALMEIKIALYHVLRKVQLVNATPDEIDVADYTAFPTLKQPIHLEMKPRTR